jgi:hypothetical protein
MNTKEKNNLQPEVFQKSASLINSGWCRSVIVRDEQRKEEYVWGNPRNFKFYSLAGSIIVACKENGIVEKENILPYLNKIHKEIFDKESTDFDECIKSIMKYNDKQKHKETIIRLMEKIS